MWAVKTRDALPRGEGITYEVLKQYETYRVFSSSVCSCLAFSPSWQCFHVVAARLAAGAKLPLKYDTTPLASSARGRPKKSPGRYATPRSADDKDLEIAQLKKRIAMLQGAKQVGPLKRKPAAAPSGQERSRSSSKGAVRLPLARPGHSQAPGPAKRTCTPGRRITCKKAKVTPFLDYSDGASQAQSQTVWNGRYFERQSGAYCGMHAINNILGAPAFTIDDMERACREVEAETGEPISWHMSSSGDYSLSAIAKVIDLTAPPPRARSWLAQLFQVIGQHLYPPTRSWVYLSTCVTSIGLLSSALGRTYSWSIRCITHGLWTRLSSAGSSATCPGPTSWCPTIRSLREAASPVSFFGSICNQYLHHVAF